jgi:AP2-like factor (euAP2 lineage)
VVPYKGKWLARVTYRRRRHHVGTFDDEVDAAKARDRKAIELFGEFARLNFPERRDDL